MTVLDIGAHHGFYAILSSKKVGRSGRVIAFEPSPRERRRLRIHLALNRCRNVIVEPWALTAHDGRATLFLVGGGESSCNSLRKPAVSEPTQTIAVETITLDHYLKRQTVGRIDLIKIDIEGGERDLLRGSELLLQRYPRPVLLVEMAEVRTAPWGYSASAIYDLLDNSGYRWFTCTPDGGLASCPKSDVARYENLVAVPKETLPTLTSFTQAREGVGRKAQCTKR